MSLIMNDVNNDAMYAMLTFDVNRDRQAINSLQQHQMLGTLSDS